MKTNKQLAKTGNNSLSFGEWAYQIGLTSKERFVCSVIRTITLVPSFFVDSFCENNFNRSTERDIAIRRSQMFDVTAPKETTNNNPLAF